MFRSFKLWNIAMSSNELSLFSYEILGLVGRNGAGAHDLRRMAREGRMLDWAGESQYYVEPKRLAKLGYLETRTEPGKTRERTVYTLTEKGLEALREYARTPLRFTPLKSETLLRLLIADLSAQLDAVEARADSLPHRHGNLLLVTEFLRRLLDLHLELVEKVERRVVPEPGPLPSSSFGRSQSD